MTVRMESLSDWLPAIVNWRTDNVVINELAKEYMNSVKYLSQVIYNFHQCAYNIVYNNFTLKKRHISKRL